MAAEAAAALRGERLESGGGHHKQRSARCVARARAACAERLQSQLCARPAALRPAQRGQCGEGGGVSAIAGAAAGISTAPSLLAHELPQDVLALHKRLNLRLAALEDATRPRANVFTLGSAVASPGAEAIAATGFALLEPLLGVHKHLRASSLLIRQAWPTARRWRVRRTRRRFAEILTLCSSATKPRASRRS
jgi:hypothetical protein